MMIDTVLIQLEYHIGYYHVELIRCHEFPHIEGEYVIEVCRDHSSYKVWPVDRAKLGWKWKFSDIERCIWHPSGTKLEVECQRYYNDIIISSTAV